MSRHPSTNKDQTQERAEEVEEGYETPTAEEHRIPAVDYDSPPPAPGKRRRLFVDDTRISVSKVIFVEDKELESFFDLLESQFRRPLLPTPVPEGESESEPEPEPELEAELGASPKKICSDNDLF